jgi:hypothetical protein
MIDAHVWMRRQASRHGEWDMITLDQVKHHLNRRAKRYNLVADVQEVEEEPSILSPGGRRVKATLSNPNCDRPIWAYQTVALSDLEREGVAVFDDFFRRAAPTLAHPPVMPRAYRRVLS